jgi:hypothetical protein
VFGIETSCPAHDEPPDDDLFGGQQPDGIGPTGADGGSDAGEEADGGQDARGRQHRDPGSAAATPKSRSSPPPVAFLIPLGMYGRLS